MTEPTSHTLTAPTATLAYDVRAGADPTQPALLLIGSPMGAQGFTTLAGHFPDRTVVTYDPRAAGRSRRTDGARVTTPEEHADDLHRIVDAMGGGPVDVFATSGGAVNALVLVARHPEDVRILVAHEPPAAQELPDRETMLAVTEDIDATYRRSGFGPAMAKFIAVVSAEGPLPADYLDRPAPDPAMFGMSTEDDGSRDDPLLRWNLAMPPYRPDADALRASPVRIVPGIGALGEGTMARRGAEALAALLGVEPVVFPGDHGGFTVNEWSPGNDPAVFADTLREVLGGNE